MQRPLSPHLQVYRPQVTSVMSIMHRAAGVAASAGIVFVSLLFMAAPYGAGTWQAVADLVFSTPGALVLALFAAAVYRHLCNGIRHLVWDSGRGLDIASIRRSAIAVLAVAAVLTLAAVFS